MACREWLVTPRSNTSRIMLCSLWLLVRLLLYRPSHAHGKDGRNSCFSILRANSYWRHDTYLSI